MDHCEIDRCLVKNQWLLAIQQRPVISLWYRHTLRRHISFLLKTVIIMSTHYEFADFFLLKAIIIMSTFYEFAGLAVLLLVFSNRKNMHCIGEVKDE